MGRRTPTRTVNGLTLYKGIIIGIAGLLALFLTIVFVVKGALIFPAAAALAWAVLAYACIDFGFFQRIFPITETTEQVYRAGAEAVLAATLLVFLFAYLNLNRWHVRYSHVTAFWLVFLGALVGAGRRRSAGGLGRCAHLDRGVAGIGFMLVLHLATHGYDRAVMLVPTWLLLVAWVTAAASPSPASSPRSRAAGADRRPRADRHADRLHGDAARLRRRRVRAGLINDTERRALALSGAGDIVFDWDVHAPTTSIVSPEVEHQLGLQRGALEGPASDWLDLIHPFDKDRYRARRSMR